VYTAMKLETLRAVYLVTTIGIASVSQIFYHRGTTDIVHVSRSHCLRKGLKAKNKVEFCNAGNIANCQTKIPEIFRRIFGQKV